MSTLAERLEEIRDDNWRWEGTLQYADEHAGDLATVGPPIPTDLDPDDFAESLWEHAVSLTRAYAEMLKPL